MGFPFFCFCDHSGRRGFGCGGGPSCTILRRAIRFFFLYQKPLSMRKPEQRFPFTYSFSIFAFTLLFAFYFTFGCTFSKVHQTSWSSDRGIAKTFSRFIHWMERLLCLLTSLGERFAFLSPQGGVAPLHPLPPFVKGGRKLYLFVPRCDRVHALLQPWHSEHPAHPPLCRRILLIANTASTAIAARTAQSKIPIFSLTQTKAQYGTQGTPPPTRSRSASAQRPRRSARSPFRGALRKSPPRTACTAA